MLQVDLRILGPNVLPFDSGKQNAVITGVASVLGNVSVSDIGLTVLKTYDVSLLAYTQNALMIYTCFRSSCLSVACICVDIQCL